MAFLLDTLVAILLRDGNPRSRRRWRYSRALYSFQLSHVSSSRAAHREPAQAPIRRAQLDAMLSAIPALAFDDLAAKTYGAIVASVGYSRRKLLDRMIAAQALVHRATLATSTRMTSPGPWSSETPRLHEALVVRSNLPECSGGA